MAPQKSLPAAKVALVLSYFRTTLVAHTLKDLEKSLPTHAGISSMAVKDYLTQLTSDSLLSVEKIGSGNWYWSFPADAQKAKELMLEEARKERNRLRDSVGALETMRNEMEKEDDGSDEREKVVEVAERLESLKKKRTELKKVVEMLEGGVVEEGKKEKVMAKVNLLIGEFRVSSLKRLGSHGRTEFSNRMDR